MSQELLKREYSDTELIDLAKRRIKTKRGMYSHIAAYVFVNTFMIAFILLSNEFASAEVNSMWIIPAGWGLGLAFHIFAAIMNLKFKYNSDVLNNEIEKIKGNKE